MTRHTLFVLGGLLAAVFFFLVQFPDHASVVPGDSLTAAVASDGGVCQADVDLPLQVELEAPPTASPGVPATALIRVTPRRTAERVELEVRASNAVSLGGLPGSEGRPLGAGQEATFDLTATLEPGRSRGTVDVLVTAWIEGLPYERGVTWNLARELPPTGQIVPREGRLPVRELPVGRAR